MGIMEILVLLYWCIAMGFGFSITLFSIQGEKSPVVIVIAWLLFTLMFPMILGMGLGIIIYKQWLTKLNIK